VRKSKVSTKKIFDRGIKAKRLCRESKNEVEFFWMNILMPTATGVAVQTLSFARTDQ
jgi:hypothetical protein